MIGALIMLAGITAVAWIVVLLDEHGRRAERTARAGAHPRHVPKNSA